MLAQVQKLAGVPVDLVVLKSLSALCLVSAAVRPADAESFMARFVMIPDSLTEFRKKTGKIVISERLKVSKFEDFLPPVDV